METHLDRLKEFHGHLGPYVVIGWRMGRKAMTELGVAKHFGVDCHVVCADEPPESCLIDGVQLATGCTMGKRNIAHEVGGPIVVRVTAKEKGVRVVLRPREDSVAQAVALMREQGEEAAVAWLESAGDEAIMRIEKYEVRSQK
jgi:formylmethanofuran dehydrogenase subunit E